MTLGETLVRDYFRQRPYYYTDGKGHFFSHVSHRKAQGLKYVGRFLNAKEARKYWNILNGGEL